MLVWTNGWYDGGTKRRDARCETKITGVFRFAGASWVIMPCFFSVKNGVYLQYVRGTSCPLNHGAMGGKSPQRCPSLSLVGWKKSRNKCEGMGKRKSDGCFKTWDYIFCVRMGIEYIPGTQMSSIFEGQPHIIRPFPFKTRVLWVPGVYIYIYPIYILYSLLSQALLTVTFAQGVIPKRSTQRSLPLEVMTS